MKLYFKFVKSVCFSAASLKDDLFVCLEDGWVHRISWNGDVRQELSFNIKNVPLSADQVNARCMLKLSTFSS